MNPTSVIDTLFHGRLRSATRSLLWLGIAMTALGVVALVFPVVSTLAATLFVGWLLLLFGGFTLAGSFSLHGAGPFFGALLLALLSIAAGVFLLFNPRAGEIALTLMVGAIFMVQGAYEMAFAFEMRPLAGWVAVLLSAITSIVMAALIVAGWPGISLIVLGILVGVNFISTGLGYIVVSRAMKPLT
jgi:uncharacterized membrane protein HdeD (DUF308 family)